MDWRRIEAALVEIAKRHAIWIEDINGDSHIWICEGNDENFRVSLTEIAKELAERLGSRA